MYHPEQTHPEFQFQSYLTDLTSKELFVGVSFNRSDSSPGYLMNSKSEYKQGEVARVTLVR